jgi:Tol biopolymer transport system component
MSRKLNWSGMLLIVMAIILIAAMVVVEPAFTQGKGGGKGKPPKDPPPPPPNSWIAYIGTNFNDIHLSDGIESGLLLSTEGECGPPSWSPDGSEIALYMVDGNGGHCIYGVATDGSGSVSLIYTYNPDPYYYHYLQVDWSQTVTPTGIEMILFTDSPPPSGDPNEERRPEVYAVDPIGYSDPVRLTFEEGPVDMMDVVWSPDATRFAAVRADENATNRYELRIYEIGLVSGELAIINETPLAGMASTPLEGHWFFGPDWSHDGNWIVVNAPPGGSYRINVNNPFDVVQLTPDDEGGRWPRFSPDDSKIIFTKKVKEGKIKGWKLHSINSSDGSSLTRLLETDHQEFRPGIRPF